MTTASAIIAANYKPPLPKITTATAITGNAADYNHTYVGQRHFASSFDIVIACVEFCQKANVAGTVPVLGGEKLSLIAGKAWYHYLYR